MIVEEILIPKSRVAVLIGTSGKIKRAIEKIGKVKIKIDENLIIISSEEAINIWNAKRVIEAIARGFNPEIAKLLFRDEFDLYLLDLSQYANSEKRIRVTRGRIIGEKGTTKKKLQEYTNTSISIYGKTVGILGQADDVQLARHAVEMILEGAKQTTAYYFLEKQRDLRIEDTTQKFKKAGVKRNSGDKNG